jgi:hypothetical protein
MVAMSAPQESESFQERVARRPLRDAYQGSENLWGYRAAAAVLASFQLEELRPLEGDHSSKLRTELLVECDVVSSEQHITHWSLKTPVRQTTLRRLFDTSSLDSALQANPNRESSSTQRIFETCIDLNGPLPPSPQTLEDAAAMLEVSYWLQSVPTLWQRIVPRDSIRQFIAREQLLEPFRSLTGDHFAGRREELNTLSDYVGVFDAASLSESVVRVFENIFDIVARPPLFVFGPGGAGKSTLIAKFILEHAEHEGYAQFPFAYLDFDRAALVVEKPITLIFEIMRQLSVQYPPSVSGYQRIAQDWTARVYARAEAPSSIEDAEDSSAPASSADAGRDLDPDLRASFLAEFANFVGSLQPSESPQPLLLVLDTFEEVQLRSSASEDDVFDLLAQMQNLVPRLRTVISGRAEIISTRYKVKELKVEYFDEAAALALLHHLGIEDPEVARMIFKQVGGSPLVLRLAADVARREGVDKRGIQGLGSRWLDIFRSESVEVVLYKRILSHVYDKRIQRLANPGLVLRYITPEVLLNVLGPASGVTIDGIADARSLVREMRRQLATILVPTGESEKLAHHIDMRKILLADLTARAKKDTATASVLKEIHERAMTFYSSFNDPESRAEELIHRFYLGQDRSLLKERWQDQVGPYLGSVMWELPSEAQGFIAARTGFDVSEDVWNHVADDDWVLIAARRIQILMDRGRPKEGAEVLLTRVKRSKVDARSPEYRGLIETILSGYARFYEELRKKNDSGPERTRLMSVVVGEVRDLAKTLRLDASNAEVRFAEGKDGDRVVGLAVAQADPRSENLPIAIDAIGSARSPFEQYNGLALASALKTIPPALQPTLRSALNSPTGVPFHSTDPSRLMLRERLLRKMPATESGFTAS